MKKNFTFLSLIVLLTINLRASSHSDSTKVVKQIGLKVHQGFVLIHSRELRSIRNSYPTGLEFDFAWHKISQKAWESCHCYPKTGIATSFWDYDNREVLGYGITSMFYIEPVFGARNAISFSIRAAFGLSYQTKPYHPENNPDNLSYSTFIAFPLQLGGSVHFRIKPKWYLDVTLVYNHFSNGGIKEPNKGINWPTAAIGVGHYLKRPEFKDRVKNNWRELQKPESRFDVTFFMAFKEPVSKLYMFSPGIELKYSRQVSRINALTGGTEIIADNFASYDMELAGIDESHIKWSFAVGNEFILGKFLFSQQIGVYVYNHYSPSDDIYHRWGLAYRIGRNLTAGINLKVHRHIADFIDFRIGYAF